jgi:hypothetical protein
MFKNVIHAGQDIKPWLMTGPFYKNLVGVLDERTYFENKLCRVGEEAAEEAMDGFSKVLLNAAPKENDVVEYPYDMTGKWCFLSTPEIYHGFGQYFVTNHLGMVAATNRLYSEKAQTVKMHLTSRRLNRMRLILNGKVVMDNYDLLKRDMVAGIPVGDAIPMDAEVELQAGENVLTLISLRIARNAEMGWQLTLTECEEPVTAVTPLNMDEELRAGIENSLATTHMVADTIAEGDPVRMVIGNNCVAKVNVTMTDSEGKVWFNEGVEEGALTLSEDTPKGAYAVKAVWTLDGEVFAEKKFAVTACEILQALPGYENYAERQRIFLEAAANQDPFKNPRVSSDVIWARYALGQYDRISYAMVQLACNIVERRDDCADFVLLPLLRIVHSEKIEAKLPPRYIDCIKHAALNFKYWVDEANDCLMWFDSENHRMGFHTLEYLAGLLFPQDIFSNSGQNGLFHAMKGRMHLIEWLSQRIRFGYNEFNSDSYLPITTGPLIAIQEMAPFEEFNLITMARELTNITVFYLAANSFNGAMASPRGRSYNMPMRNPLMQGTTSILYLLFGRDRAGVKLEPGSMALAISKNYMPPKGICDVAYDYNEMVNYFKSGFYHWGKQNADITAIRTPEYMLSSVRNHNVTVCEAHLHVSQATLPKDTIIFFSAPFTRQEGSGLRPDYWAGQSWTPETYQYRGTLGVCWWDVKDPFVWMTHCHFDADKFDEIRHRDHWTFGRVGDSYVGIWSANEHELATTGTYANRELISNGKENSWILELGSAREDGDFEQFVEKLLAAQIVVGDHKVTFESPKNGTMEFCKAFKVAGELIPIRSMVIDSKYVTSRYGSGTYDYNFEDLEGTVWTYASSI